MTDFPLIEEQPLFQRYYHFLKTALEDEVIYNVDFNDMKSGLSRAYEKSIDPARMKFAGCDRFAPEASVYWDTESFLHIASSGLKKLKKVEAVIPPEKKADFDHLVAIHEQGVEIWNRIKQAKAFIVKGRKPSTAPRKTEPRTLDNTGTCPICNQNTKMLGVRIVHHGFTIKWGNRDGSCFGVGYKPIEISPEGAVDYKKMLEGFLKSSQRGQTSLAKKVAGLEDGSIVETEEEFEKREAVHKALGRYFFQTNPTLHYQGKLREIKSEISQSESNIRYFENTLKEWKPRQLPKEGAQ